METKMTDRVKQILSWYASDNPGTLTNLARLLMHGRLGGTGKLVILPVDQGFEHGPARSFAPNPDGYDPRYHFQLAIEAGCNAYAAPLGFLEAGAAEFAGQVPLILKLNNSDSLSKLGGAPISAVTASVEDAVRLGCVAIGYTIYPASDARNEQLENLRELTLEAKAHGLAVVVWSYPRGSGVSKEGETAVDIAAYAAHMAAQMGAHVIKVKPPKELVEHPEAKKVYEKYNIPVKTLSERVRHVVQSAFNGRRIVIFSGGEAKGTEELLKEIQAIKDGGAFGSIMGRNAFQRPKAEFCLRSLADCDHMYPAPQPGLERVWSQLGHLARGQDQASTRLRRSPLFRAVPAFFPCHPRRAGFIRIYLLNRGTCALRPARDRICRRPAAGPRKNRTCASIPR